MYKTKHGKFIRGPAEGKMWCSHMNNKKEFHGNKVTMYCMYNKVA